MPGVVIGAMGTDDLYREIILRMCPPVGEVGSQRIGDGVEVRDVHLEQRLEKGSDLAIPVMRSRDSGWASWMVLAVCSGEEQHVGESVVLTAGGQKTL